MRLQAFLARAGAAPSRRKAEAPILAGRVAVNGETASLGATVTPEDEVTLDGTARRILGNGERGIVDGADTKARLSFPNGIVRHPWAQRLYINEFVNETPSSLPRRAIVREIILGADQP